MTDLHCLSLSDLYRRLKGGELSSVNVIEAILARIERLAPQLKAYVTVLADGARATAAALDERRKNGQPGGTNRPKKGSKTLHARPDRPRGSESGDRGVWVHDRGAILSPGSLRFCDDR